MLLTTYVTTKSTLMTCVTLNFFYKWYIASINDITRSIVSTKGLHNFIIGRI